MFENADQPRGFLPPGFLHNPAILKWLEKPNGSIDFRFEDLLDVLRKKFSDMQEEP